MILHILIYKHLARKTVSDKILKDGAYKIAVNRKYNGYQRALSSMIYNIFDKKRRSRVTVKEKLAQKLHKPIINKIQRKKNRDLKTILG